MQEIYNEICAPMLRDLLDMKTLTIACYHPNNTRDLLMPSTLKECEGEKNDVEHHLQNTLLQHCIASMNYDEHRKFEIKNEHIKLQQEIYKICKMSKEKIKCCASIPTLKSINGQDQ